MKLEDVVFFCFLVPLLLILVIMSFFLCVNIVVSTIEYLAQMKKNRERGP